MDSSSLQATMEIGIVSREVVKPSLSHVHLFQPSKISLLDQITPTTFAPLILFYPMDKTRSCSTTTQTSTRLKESLSRTLDHFYPFSGRVRENLVIDDYDEGVPFTETRVRTHLFEFLRHPRMESLNRFLPYPPFAHQPNPEVPQVVVQLNTFDCGGVALGLCFSHKINDGATTSAFLRSWAAIARGAYGKARKISKHSNISEAATLFPPQNPSPRHYLSVMEKLWFGETNLKTRRFVFDGNAMLVLRDKSMGHNVHNPTRIEALSAFILKSAMSAASGSSSRFVMNQAVNFRSLTEPRLSPCSVGNLFLWALAPYVEHADMGLDALVAQMRRAVANINSQSLKNLLGDEGYPKVCEYVENIEDIFAAKRVKSFTFSSWLKFGFNEIDFGWGNPIWSGIFGEAGSEFRNMTFFKETGGKDHAVEAWMTLDEKLMAVLEDDPEFLSFASPNPSIDHSFAAPSTLHFL